MSQLLRNIDSIIGAFDKYAKSDGDCATLSKGELKQLIQKEFAEVIVNPYDTQTIETVFQRLDADCDSQVDFEEFTVLVFRVARACYKKERECQAQVEGQPEKPGDAQNQSQGKRTPSRGSLRRSTQQPQIPGKSPDCCTAEGSQVSSQEPQEPSKPETGGQSREPLQCKQEPTGQTSGRPIGSGPAQRQTEELQAAGWDRSHQLTSGVQRAEQDHTWQLSQEPQSQVEGSSCRCAREPQSQEEDLAQVHQALQQSVGQESCRQPQGQTQDLTGQQERKPQTLNQLIPTQQCTQEAHSSQGPTQEVQRREPQEAVEGPSCGQVQEPQKEQGGTRQCVQESRVERASPAVQQEKGLTHREQSPTAQWEQNAHTGERTTCQQGPLTQEGSPTQEGRSLQQSTTQQASRPPRQQGRELQTPERETAQQLTQNPQAPEGTPAFPRERELLTQGQGPTCRTKEASPKPEAIPSQQPTPVGQRAEQASTGWKKRETRHEREHPTGQEECPSSQGLEKNRAGRREQEPPSPQQARSGHLEHEGSMSEQFRSGQQEYKPHVPPEGQSCHQERKPKKGRAFPGEFDRGQSSVSTETPPDQGPRESSAQQGYKPSQLPSQQVQKPPQVASRWTSKQ